MFLCEGGNVRHVATVGVPTALVEFDKRRGNFQPTPGGPIDQVMRTLTAIAKRRPDLILMGIPLPIMDGYEVTRQIKANPAMRSIPIIAVTSHALDGEEQTARAAGCDGYVPEPYSPRQLLAKIQQCMLQ